VNAWLLEHSPWRLYDGHLVRDVATRDYPSSVVLLQAQVDIAEGLDHHPIVTVGYRHLRFELWTHDRDGLTTLDLAYADALDQLIKEKFSDVVVS
jgi:4a-hydroxytetrahydrobiopterin dehydratase